MRKRDLMLVVGLLILAGILYILLGGMRTGTGNYVVITVDSEEYGTYSLQEDQTICVKTDRGENLVQIKDGTVWVEDADCPDKYCVKNGPISKNKETIVCLPHHMVIEVEQKEKLQDQIDAIVK